MIKLIKLEFVKFNFIKYILNVVISILCILAFAILVGSIPDAGEMVFTSRESLVSFGEVMINIIFICFSGILIARLIIGEYKNKTIHNLFTYPISRKKILGSKLILIYTFVSISIILANYVYLFAMSFANNFTHMIPEKIEFMYMIGRSPSIIVGAFLNAAISLISLYFGMKKKSTVTTIVSSILVSVLLNMNTSFDDPTKRVADIIIIPVICAVIGILIAFQSYRNINREDVA